MMTITLPLDTADTPKTTAWAPWEHHRNRITSSKGGWRIGEGVTCHGYSMLDDLAGKHSYLQVVLLNILGKLPEKRLGEWLEALFICLSWPDPRIWCNQIGALAGTSQTTVVSATTAGILAADSTLYGSKPLLESVPFIQSALVQQRQGSTAEEIVADEIAKHRGKPNIVGFARPIARGDERIPAMERVTAQLEYSIGPHLSLAYEIDTVLNRKFGEHMNINGYAAAFLSDQGLSAENIYRISALVVASGVTACYVDARDRPAGTFLPLRCDDIDYQGKPPRPVPERE